MLKTILIFFASLQLMSCIYYEDPGNGFYIPSPDTCGFSRDKMNRSVKWDLAKFPIAFHVHGSVPDKAYYNFVSAVTHWNEVWIQYLEDREIVDTFLLFRIVGEGEKFAGTPKRDGNNMLFFLDRFEGYGQTSRTGRQVTQALTSMVSVEGRIQDTDILVNADEVQHYFDRSYDRYVLSSGTREHRYRNLASTGRVSIWQNIKNSLTSLFKLVKNLISLKKRVHTHRGLDSKRIPGNLVDFPSLMIHELGHAAGLSHIPAESEKSGEVFSIMERTLPEGQTRRDIGEYDLESLFCGYYKNR